MILVFDCFQIAVAMGQFWGETVRDLADSLILPLNMSTYASLLNTFIKQLDAGYGELMRNNSISLSSIPTILALYIKSLIFPLNIISIIFSFSIISLIFLFDIISLIFSLRII